MNLHYLPLVANHLWQSTLFAGVAWLLTLALRNNRARVRHWVWLAASCKFLVPLSALIALGGHIQWRSVPEAAQSNIAIAIDEVSQPFTAPVLPSRQDRPSPSHLYDVLCTVWALGFLGISGAWWIRWRRIRDAVYAGLPLPLKTPVPAICSPVLVEPAIFGVVRPVLLLPEGIFDRLTPAQLDSIVAHELCHVRHRDNFMAAMHMFVETVFWFHPLVWWVGKHIVAERERACDEEVLRLGSDPRIYAEGILNVCKLYVESPLPCVAGATGPDLKRRIEAIMANRVGHGLTRAKKLLLAIAGIAALAVPVVIGASQAPAQMAPDFVALQEGAGPPPRSTAEVMPVVSLTRNGTIYLNEKPTNIHELGRVIHERFATAKGVYVRADKETIWDALRQVLAILGQSGFQVNMVTQAEDKGSEAQKVNCRPRKYPKAAGTGSARSGDAGISRHKGP